MVSKITLILKRNQIILDDEIEIYQYGLEMIVSTIVNCVIVVVFGIIMKELLAAVLFFLCLQLFAAAVAAIMRKPTLSATIFLLCAYCV